jgi:hypothetical protein
VQAVVLPFPYFPTGHELHEEEELLQYFPGEQRDVQFKQKEASTEKIKHDQRKGRENMHILGIEQIAELDASVHCRLCAPHIPEFESKLAHLLWN